MKNTEMNSKKSISKCSICNGSTFVFRCDEEGIKRAYPCECREAELMKGKFVFAEMPLELKDLKLNDYKIDIYQSKEDKELAMKAKRLSVRYISNYKVIREKNTGLYFYSDTKGSGKTRLAVAIGNALISQYKEKVKFTTTIKLLQEIRSTLRNDFNDMSFNDYLDAVKTVKVLILDDIGTEKLTDWVNETFYEIINQRLQNNLITIYTSNCKIEDLKHDSRIISRIKGNVLSVKCPEEDIRVKLQGEKNQEIERLLLS